MLLKGFSPRVLPNCTQGTPNCTQGTPQLYPGYSQLYPGYSPIVPRVLPNCTQGTPQLYPGYSPIVPRVLPNCTQGTPNCTQGTPQLYPGYSPIVPRVLPNGTQAIPILGMRIFMNVLVPLMPLKGTVLYDQSRLSTGHGIGVLDYDEHSDWKLLAYLCSSNGNMTLSCGYYIQLLS